MQTPTTLITEQSLQQADLNENLKFNKTVVLFTIANNSTIVN